MQTSVRTFSEDQRDFVGLSVCDEAGSAEPERSGLLLERSRSFAETTVGSVNRDGLIAGRRNTLKYGGNYNNL